MGIKCFVSDCNEDVIGQCPGSPDEPCGHFYCAKHSKGKLCDECAVVHEQQVLFEKYLTKAEQITKCGASITALILIAIFVVIPLSIYIFIISESVVALLLVLFGSLIILNIISRLIQKSRIEKACDELREFKSFYKSYKKNLQKDMLRTAGLITLDVVTYSLSEEARAERDIRRIRNRLDIM